MVEIEADRDTSSGVLLFASFALEVPPAYSMISDNSVCAQNPAILSEVAILRQRLAGSYRASLRCLTALRCNSLISS